MPGKTKRSKSGPICHDVGRLWLGDRRLDLCGGPGGARWSRIHVWRSTGSSLLRGSGHAVLQRLAKPDRIGKRGKGDVTHSGAMQLKSAEVER